MGVTSRFLKQWEDCLKMTPEELARMFTLEQLKAAAKLKEAQK